MKIKTTVISSLGTFESNERDVLPEEEQDIETLRATLQQYNKLNYLSLERDNQIIYIPEEVIKQSVIILDVSA